MNMFNKLKEMFNSDFFLGIDREEVEEATETSEEEAWVIQFLVDIPPHLLDRGGEEDLREWVVFGPYGLDFYEGTFEEVQGFVERETQLWQARGFVSLAYTSDDGSPGSVGVPVQHVLGWKIARLEDAAIS